jgi:hypothetical protein
MRFARADLPGIVLAGLAPVGMFLLFLDMFGLWEHRGTPLLSILALALAGSGGLLAAFTRFVHHWRVVGGLITLLVLDALAVLAVQRAGLDTTVLANVLKLAGGVLFLAANGAIVWEVVDFGLLPILDRRAARRAAALDDTVA